MRVTGILQSILFRSAVAFAVTISALLSQPRTASGVPTECLNICEDHCPNVGAHSMCYQLYGGTCGMLAQCVWDWGCTGGSGFWRIQCWSYDQ